MRAGSLLMTNERKGGGERKGGRGGSPNHNIFLICCDFGLKFISFNINLKLIKGRGGTHVRGVYEAMGLAHPAPLKVDHRDESSELSS